MILMAKSREEDKHVVAKVPALLEQHRGGIIEEMGASAFDLLTPAQVASELGVSVSTLPDLVRQSWLAGSGQKAGNAHLYYRWRVEFARRYRKPYGRKAAEGPA